jgi:hypothetical protein
MLIVIICLVYIVEQIYSLFEASTRPSHIVNLLKFIIVLLSCISTLLLCQMMKASLARWQLSIWFIANVIIGPVSVLITTFLNFDTMTRLEDTSRVPLEVEGRGMGHTQLVLHPTVLIEWFHDGCTS